MLCAEMLTDTVMHAHYPGFGRAYLFHHLFTFGAAAATLFSTGVGVGCSVLYVLFMECGGMSLNAVSLWPWATGSSRTPASLFAVRVAAFASSRVFAALVMGRTTQLGLRADGKTSLFALSLGWAVLAVNVRWVTSMVQSYRRDRSQKGGMDAFDK